MGTTSPFEIFAQAFQGVQLGPLGFLQQVSFWASSYEVTRAFFIGVDVILVCAIIYTVIHAWEFHPNLSPRAPAAGEHGHAPVLTLRNVILKGRWNKIIKTIQANSPEALKVAIIEADKLVDDALKQLGFEGETMADRLNTVSVDDVKSLERLWRAHRVRNNLVHTPGFEVSPEITKDVLSNYETFLKEIKLLE